MLFFMLWTNLNGFYLGDVLFICMNGALESCNVFLVICACLVVEKILGYYRARAECNMLESAVMFRTILRRG